MNNIEAARAAKRALRLAFPGTKFSVRSDYNSINVDWSDGPEEEPVKDALLASGCAVLDEGFDRNRHLLIPGSDWHHFHLYRSSAEERARREEERQRSLALAQRRDAAVAEELLAKRRVLANGVPRIERAALTPPPVIEQTVFDAFEALRARAEAVVRLDADEERTRRPSWAPPLVLDEELAEICRGLGLLTAEDKPIARLWATFADPRRTGSYLRERRSEHPQAGVVCRGFQLHPGGERGSTLAIMFEAQRRQSGQWQFGPRLVEPRCDISNELSGLIREREQLRDFLAGNISEETRARYCAHIERLAQRIVEIDAADATRVRERHDQYVRRSRMLDLARARVFDFIGAPDQQMAMAGRLCGNCFICWRELTDPISLERGIGPDCLGKRIERVRQLASAGREPDVIALLIGMSVEFVNTVIADQQLSFTLAGEAR